MHIEALAICVMALGVALVVYAVASLTTSPPRGRHRARKTPQAAPLQPVQRPVPPGGRLPRHRSPYGGLERLEGERHALVRPYLVAFEQEQRRTALELALDGVDAGPDVIHGVRVGVA